MISLLKKIIGKVTPSRTGGSKRNGPTYTKQAAQTLQERTSNEQETESEPGDAA